MRLPVLNELALALRLAFRILLRDILALVRLHHWPHIRWIVDPDCCPGNQVIKKPSPLDQYVRA